MTSELDRTLVRSVLAGDLRAFERLVERHREIVLRVAGRIVGDDEAEDVAQDAFLRAFHRLGRWNADTSFETWLLHFAHLSARDAMAARRMPTVPIDDRARTLADPEERTPAARLETAERLRRLDIKLLGLSPSHRTVLVLRDVEGLSYDEIAEVTDMPLGSVKARLHRARSDFIDALRRNTYDWEIP